MRENAPNILNRVIFKPSLFKFYLLFIGIAISLTTTAQNIFGVANGNWNNAANWSLNHVPNGTENLVIPTGTICNMDVNYSGGNTFTITIGGTLNIPAGATLDRTGATVILNANGATLSGGGSVNIYTLNIATPNATDVVNILNSTIAAPITIGKANAVGTVNFTQGLLKLTGQILGIAKTATLNGNGGNFANSADGAGGVDADGGTLLLLGSSGGTTTVNGSVTFNNVDFGSDGNVILDLKTATSVINGVAKVVNQQGRLGNTNSPIWGASSTLNISYNNGFNYTPGKEWVSMASGTIGVTPGYPNNVILSNTGSSAGGFNNANGWVPSGAWAINGVFTLGNNATNAQVDFSNVSSFTSGGFVLNTDSRFTAPKTTMTVKGNWTDNQAVSGTSKGFFINGISTVVFSGTGTCDAPNTISGPGGNAETFNNLSIAANVSLLTPVTVNTTGNLTLTSGILTTKPSGITVNNTNVSAVIGGSATSYINGPLKWSLGAGANLYSFAVGDGTCIPAYLPFTLNKTATAATVATVQAFNTPSGGTVDGTLSSLGSEYWSLSTTVSLSAGSKISVARPTLIAPLASIAKSTTQTGVYSSIGGTAVPFGVNSSNDIGTGSQFFFALGAPPIVSTLMPTSITTTSATLQGAFNTMDAAHPTSFNYGTTTGYGSNAVTLHSPITSNSSQADSAAITGLTANTEYHVQATDGTNSGSDVKFFTAPNPPVITDATNLSGSGFTSNWTAPAAQGPAPFTYTIQISTDPTFASGVTEQTGISSAAISSPFTGLTSATTYYVRVKAVNETTSSVWSSVASATTNLVPTPPCTNNTSSDGATTFTALAPVIDGSIDGVWGNPPSNAIVQQVLPGHTNNNTQSWKSVWTADSLYILVQVTDASLISQPIGLGGVPVAGATTGTSGNYYEVDGIEFYLDADNNPGNTYDIYNDIQLRFNLGATSLSGQSAGGTAQFVGATFNRVAPLVNWKIVVTPTGYLLEAAIPWGKDAANPGIFLLPPPPSNTYGDPTNGQVIGIDVGVNDQDNPGGDRQAQTQWNGNSTGSYIRTDQFKSVSLQVCPEPPVVTSPTKTLITATSAQLGATVITSGKSGGVTSPLTTRGTAFSLVNPVFTNAQAEGGNTLGIYSHVRTGLAPQTKYYYVGYANNAANLTGVSGVDSFYTLSALPTTTPQLSSVICPGITLNWTAVTFPPADQATQTGYLVLRRQDGNNPTSTGITTRVATKQADLPGGTTLLATIPSGATLTYTDANVTAGTTYNYLLVPFTWDGVITDSTYNYAIGEGSATTSATAAGGEIKTPEFSAIAPICAGGSFSLPTTSNNQVTGTWSPAIDNQNTTEYTFTPDQGQCATIYKLTVTVNQLASPAFSTIAPICAGGSFALPTASNDIVPITGTWSPAINNQGTTEYTFTPNQGQCATTFKMTVTVDQPKTPQFADIAPICAGGSFNLPTTSINDVTGTWSPAPNNQSTTEYTFTPTQEQCAISVKKIVTVFTKPTVTASADPITVGSGGSVTLTGTSSVQGTYSWSASPQTSIQSSNSQIATSNPTANTLYTFTVSYGEGCSESDDVSVTFNDLTCLDPLKGFTPNGDTHNDTWRVYRDAGCFAKVMVDVYNRWGGLVYHADNYANNWDGKYKGKPVPDATYYYIIKATNGSGRTQTLTGNVTIIR
ncbi:MAG: sugar-binding protein [Bacteroidota bacterium]